MTGAKAAGEQLERVAELIPEGGRALLAFADHEEAHAEDGDERPEPGGADDAADGDVPDGCGHHRRRTGYDHELTGADVEAGPFERGVEAV